MPKNATNIRHEEIIFMADGFKLRGMLHLPEADHPPLVIGSHGLFSSGDSPKQIALGDACARKGIAFFRFDHRGCGLSQGIFSEVMSLEGRVIDLKSALALLKNRTDLGAPLGFFGSSMGGATVLAAAAEVCPAAVVTLAAPVKSLPILEAAKSSGDLRGLPLKFYEDNLSFDLTRYHLENISNILIFHGEADQVVPVDNAHWAYESTSEPKRLVLFPEGDHRVSNADHQRQLMDESLGWFAERLL